MNYLESWVNHRAGSGGLAGPSRYSLRNLGGFPAAGPQPEPVQGDPVLVDRFL